ncbi:phage tail tape measure protein [Streptomyces virginiae]|uniref:phage tail tape measure protein n=1 Tax=Streptomyces virginiae TaxID=1961 RepID=UPI0036A8306A
MADPIKITLIGDADQLSQTLDEAGQEISRFGETAKALALAAGGAIALGIGAGIAEALDQGHQTDVLAAQLGASPEEAQRLGKAAGQVYSAGYGESIAEANESLKHLWQQGLVPAGATADEMANISKQALNVATVLGEDVGPTANAVGQMLKTGMAKNAQEAFDILTVGAQNGANKSEDLLDTFNEYSVLFQRVGLDGKTSLGLISQALQAGARDSDQVADALGIFGEVALKGGKAVDEAYASIGVNGKEITALMQQGGASAQKAFQMTTDALRNTKDETVQLNAAAALFGDPANTMGKALYAMNPAAATAANGLDQVDGAAKRAGDTMHDNASTKLKEFTRGLTQGVVEFLGGQVVPAIEKLADKLSWIGTGFAMAARFVDRFSTPLTVLASIIGVILLPAMVAWGVTATTAAIANVTAWITSTTTATTSAATQVLAHWSVVGGWLKSAATAVVSAATVVGGWILMGTQALMQAARMAAAWLIAMGPVGLVIAIIVGLAVLIYKNWDTIVEYTTKAFEWVWEKVKAIFGFLWNLFLNFTGPGLIIKHWDTIVNATRTAFDWVRKLAEDALNYVVNFVTGLPGRLLNAGSSIVNAGRQIGGYVIDGISSGLSKLGGFASSLATSVTAGAKYAINSVIDLLNWAIPDRLGWGSFSIDLPANPVPKIRAMGGPAAGLTRVGERGPEWVNLPKGSTVIPNHAAPDGGGIVVNVQSNADPYAIGRAVAWALRTTPR